MKRMGRISILLAMLLVVMVPNTAAQEKMTIVEVAGNDDRFTTLFAAIEAADYDSTLFGGGWTLFAPTDEAFAKLGLNAKNIGTKYSAAELANLILYHTLTEVVSTAEAKTMLGDVSMANGRLAGLKWFDDAIWINDDSKVIDKDIQAANGVIHAVDTVIQPPWPRGTADSDVETSKEAVDLPDEESSTSIVAVLDDHRRFDTISAAIQAAGLVETFSSGEWTIFAPDDSTFKKLGLKPNNIGQAYSKQELADLILYHALREEVTIDKAKTMLGDVTMANGQVAGLKYYRRRIWVNDDVKVTRPDIRASTGIIHGVNNIILPPWPRVDEEMPQTEGQ
jgi:transforming growth factor-beta-induced protein